MGMLYYAYRTGIWTLDNDSVAVMPYLSADNDNVAMIMPFHSVDNDDVYVHVAMYV